MKHFINAATVRKTKTVAGQHLSYHFKENATPLFYLMILLGTFLFTGCSKHDINEPKVEHSSVDSKEESADMESIATHNITLCELQQAREATAKYQNFSNAIADHYADINLVMPNMGYHFMKSKFVDSIFEIRKPEVLVYNKDREGNFQLVAVEYAVPLDQSADAPKGFTGKRDVWDRNTEFGLWTLHAWVWQYNPDGVFNPTNPAVHVR